MNLRDYLQREISRPDLQARKTQAQFAPSLTYGRHFGKPAWNAKPAAVLVLFFNQGGTISIPFTVRPKTLRDHGGQVSFPGGMQEDNESSKEAALREFREELGCSSDRIEVLGSLSPINVYNSNFYVTPWVAWSDESLAFSPNPAEVEKVFSMPATELIRSDNYGSFTVSRGAVSFQAASINWREFRIWGATCVILGEVISILKSFESK